MNFLTVLIFGKAADFLFRVRVVFLHQNLCQRLSFFRQRLYSYVQCVLPGNGFRLPFALRSCIFNLFHRNKIFSVSKKEAMTLEISLLDYSLLSSFLIKKTFVGERRVFKRPYAPFEEHNTPLLYMADQRRTQSRGCTQFIQQRRMKPLT